MWRDLSKTLRELLEMPDDAGSYRPDLHYMRGPGPKCAAKRAGLPASAAHAPRNGVTALGEIAKASA